MQQKCVRLGLIGYGSIGRELAQRAGDHEGVDTIGALVLDEELEVAAPFPLVSDLDGLLALGPELVVECASHAAVRDYAPPVLAAGIDLMIISIGALSDAALLSRVQDVAEHSTAQVILPAGALIGIDGLAAARQAGLDWVRLTSRKPPHAWSGAPGVAHIDLDHLAETTVVFSGSAREAARLFPKNANVAATVSLAGVGFEETQVELVADLDAVGNIHVLEFEGRPGRYRVEVQGHASPDNPKTSMLTAYTIFHTIANRSASIII